MALDTAVLTLGVDSRGAVIGANRASTAISRVGTTSVVAGGKLNKLKSVLFSVKGAFAAVAAVAVIKGLTSAAQAAMKFETALTEVSTLLGDTVGEMDALSDAAKRLAIEFGSTPVEQTKAFYQIISAGAQNAAEATNILTAANKLAIGGVTSVEVAADGLTSVLNAYGDKVASATAVSDAMFVAMKAGKTTIGELSGALGLVAPLAATAGVSFDELAGTIAALTKGGISTSTAVTGVRAILAAVVKPTSEAATAAKRLGLNFSASGLEAKGFAGFMKEVVEKTSGSTDEMALLFGGVEALVPALALAGQAGVDLGTILENMASKSGATEEAFTRMSKTAQFQLDRMNAAIEVILIALGEKIIPVLADVADAFANIFREDTPQQQMESLAGTIRSLSQEAQGLQVALDSGLGNDFQRGQLKLLNNQIDILTGEYNALADAMRDADLASQTSLKIEIPNINKTGVAVDPKIMEDAEKARLKEIETLQNTREAINIMVRARDEEMQLMQVSGVERDILANKLKLESQLRTLLAAGVDPGAIENETEALKEQAVVRDILIKKLDAEKKALEEVEKAQKKTKEEVEKATAYAGRFSDALIDSAIEGESFADAMRNTFKNMASDILKELARVVLSNVFKSLIGTIGGSFFGGGGSNTGQYFPDSGFAISSAKGNVFDNGRLTAFAKGGVVDGPTAFPMAGGTGLMGEAGPEAIMPLKRGADGKLGVSGGGTIVQLIDQRGTGAPDVEQTRERGPDGRDIVRFTIREEVNKGMTEGAFDRSMNASFGTTRKGVTR